MKIILISPKMTLRPMDSEFKRLMAPPISLLVLSALTPPEHTVEIIDENAARIKVDATAGLVGITCNIDSSNRCFEIARAYKAAGVPVIVGGIYPSARPEEALKHADSVCIGEAEDVWAQILADAGEKRLKKEYRSLCESGLENVLRPKWEAINIRDYLYTNIVTTSRGCPHSCEFCYNSCDYTIKKFRRRPVRNVIEEIQKLPSRQVLFVDDNFTGSDEWVFEFLKAVKPMKLIWHAAVSADIGTKPRLLDMMAETGCRSLYIGFESINARSISSVNKSQNLVEKYDRTIGEIHGRGIMINSSMVFGFDHDGPSVFDDTLAWLIRNRIETMTAHILTPYPGTKLFERLEREGRITDRNTERYNTASVVFKPALMTPEELLNGYLDIYDRFYSLKNIYKRRPLQISMWPSYFMFNLFYRKFGKITSAVGKAGLMNAFGRLARKLSYGIG